MASASARHGVAARFLCSANLSARWGPIVLLQHECVHIHRLHAHADTRRHTQRGERARETQTYTSRTATESGVSNCPLVLVSFPTPRLCCRMMGWASGWESQILQKSPSHCKCLCPRTSFGWESSFLTPHTTSGYPAPAARGLRPGPTGFRWRPRREVRRAWEEGAVGFCFH